MPEVTWTSAAAIAAWLGPTVATAEPARLDECAAAANAWAWRHRVAAGYVDDPALADADVVEGTTLYGVTLYRQRAVVDGYPSFDEVQVPIAASTFPRIKSLLGIPRAGTDRLPVAPAPEELPLELELGAPPTELELEPAPPGELELEERGP